MNKFLIILTALLLSGCAAKVSQLQTPEKIEYNGKTYKLTASQDLDTIARYVYIAEPETLENWKSQIEVLLDREYVMRQPIAKMRHMKFQKNQMP